MRKFQPLGLASVEQLRAELSRQQMHHLYQGRGDKYQWIICSHKHPAGWITLVINNWEHGLAEVGYALSTSFQGRSIMSEALTLLLTDLFRRTQLQRLEARCAVDNLASQKVLRRLGFKLEGRLRGYFLLRGKRVDNLLFAMLRSDFLAAGSAAT